MAVQDTKLFKKWEPAYDNEQKRRAFYKSLKAKLPAKHPLVRDAKAKYKAARIELDKVFDEDK